MNRRNLLVSIGTAAVGTGAVLGSGALTSVEANRSVDVTTAGDSASLIGITGDGEFVNSSPTDTLSIDIGSSLTNADGLNDDAKTVVKGILTITNNSNAPVVISLGNDSTSVSGAASTSSDGAGEASQLIEVNDNGSPIGTVSFSLDGGEQSVGANSAVTVDATIGTGSEMDSGTPDGSDSLSIIAQEDPNA